MSVVLALEVETSSLEQVIADVLVTPFFSCDRPLRGPAARADWRLCGLLSERLQQEQLTGARGEAALMPTAGRMRSPLLLVIGLGPRSDFGEEALREVARSAAVRLLGLRSGIVGIALPGDSRLAPRHLPRDRHRARGRRRGALRAPERSSAAPGRAAGGGRSDAERDPGDGRSSLELPAGDPSGAVRWHPASPTCHPGPSGRSTRGETRSSGRFPPLKLRTFAGLAAREAALRADRKCRSSPLRARRLVLWSLPFSRR